MIKNVTKQYHNRCKKRARKRPSSLDSATLKHGTRMHRGLSVDFAGLNAGVGNGGKDLAKLFQSMPASLVVQDGLDSFDHHGLVFSKHRIRKIEVTPQDDRSAATTQLLNSEVALLQATIQNKDILLVNARQEMHELRLKMQQQSAENRSLKKELIEMKEAAARISEQHATETQIYLAKVMDAEEKTLHAASAMDLAANVHKAATSAQRAASSVRFENMAFKRDKDRLIHLLSLFEPAKALASQLQQIPSNYFPLPGIGTSAISTITKAQLTSASSFVKPLISKKFTAECSLWMSSKIASIVLGWGTENDIDESTLVQLVEQLSKVWTDSTKRAKELASVARLKKKRIVHNEPLNESQNSSSRKDRSNKKKDNSLAPEQTVNASLNSFGKLLESGLSRLRMKSLIEEDDGLMQSSKPNYQQCVYTPQFLSPNAIQTLYKSDEPFRDTHDILPLELIESLKQEMMFVSDLSVEKHSSNSPHNVRHQAPFDNGEIVLRNTSFRISLLHE